jgi:response regulator RpfG family c-di-GMP phosphodiesterase
MQSRKVNKASFVYEFLLFIHTNLIVVSMKILMLNDDEDSVSSYKRELKLRHHSLFVTSTTEACLKLYQSELQEIYFNTDPVEHIQPFDIVILECESCGASGMEISKEILTVNPRQRIVLILTSEVYQSIAKKSEEGLNTSIEIIQKPLSIQSILDMIELKEVYSTLEKMHLDTDVIRRANFRHDQILDILNIVTNERNRN